MLKITSGNWDYSASQKDFGNPMPLTFGGQREGDGLVTGLENFKIEFNEINENETEVVYSGKLDAGVSNLNHLMVRGYAEVVGDNGSFSYSIDQVLMPEDINPMAHFL